MRIVTQLRTEENNELDNTSRERKVILINHPKKEKTNVPFSWFMLTRCDDMAVVRRGMVKVVIEERNIKTRSCDHCSLVFKSQLLEDNSMPSLINESFNWNMSWLQSWHRLWSKAANISHLTFSESTRVTKRIQGVLGMIYSLFIWKYFCFIYKKLKILAPFRSINLF